MTDHNSESTKAICSGFALGVVNDLRPKGKYNFLQNIRVLLEGELRSRKKVDAFLTLDYAPGPNPNRTPHSLKTIFNRTDSIVNRIVGIGDDLFSGLTTTLTKKDTGFSTVPLSIVDFRPEESSIAYAYISDKLKFVKLSVNDDYSPVGLDAPIMPLGFSITKPNRKIIDNIVAADIADWNNLTGSAQVPTIVTRVSTTIKAFLLDDVAPGFASIVPEDADTDIQNGCILILNGTDEVFVEEVCPATLQTGSATIAIISYDTGSTGSATIVLSTSDVGLRRNAVVKLNASEYVRVLEVSRDVDGTPSIRVNTVGTFAIGDSVEGFASFRTSVENSYSVADTILAEHLETILTADGISSITNIIDIDLTNANSKALSEDDFLHISLQPADPSLITEIQIQLGYDLTFDENYFYFPITPNFFISSALQTNSTLLTIQEYIQRQELINHLPGYRRNMLGLEYDGNYDSIPVGYSIPQTALGQNTWTELFLRIGDFIRSGTDSSKTKRNITHLRISINATAATAVRVDSIWIGGGSTLDTKGAAKFLKYNYVWRVRDNITKNPSNWSPPLREGIETNRTNIQLTPPVNSFSADFLIDIARFGGTLNDWRIVGSVINDGSVFVDTVSDRTAAQNPAAARKLPDDEEVFDFYKPFVYKGNPISGTCDVIGTKFIWKTNDKLNVNYPRGVAITIDGVFNQFYVNPTDDEHVELEKDMGSLTDVKFEIPSPLLVGQPVQIIFGPWGEGSSGLIIFGIRCLDGVVYWLDGNSPDTMSDLNFLEITSPSEPIIGGLIYDGFPFVFTTRRSFTLYPTYQTGNLSFIARENANSRGILGSYCVCVGRDYIYQVSENGDGIYRSQGGGNPENLTDGSLFNLFIHNGVKPSPVTLIDETIIYPPNFDLPDSIRLAYCKDLVFFRFTDTNTNDVALIFDERIKDWISYDTYLDGIAGVPYQEELPSGLIIGHEELVLIGIEGAVGKFAGLTSREDEIQSIILPFASDQGDSNLLKQYDEVVLDIDKGELDGFSSRNYYNNGDSNDALVNIAGITGAKRSKIVQTVNKLARNITTKLSWNLKSLVKFYEEQIYFIPRADEIVNRPSDSNEGGFFGEKFWQGIVIEADTFGQDKVLQFYADDDLVTPAAEITINTTGKETVSKSFPIPFIAHSVVRRSDDDVSWIFYKEVYKVDKEPELALVWEGQETTFDIPGFKVIKRQAIAYRSTAEVRMQWVYDNDVTEEYILPSTAGARGKYFFFLRPRKGKVLKPRSESDEEFRIYRKDCEAWIRGFNLQNDYEIKLPFGDDHRQTEVRI